MALQSTNHCRVNRAFQYLLAIVLCGPFAVTFSIAHGQSVIQTISDPTAKKVELVRSAESSIEEVRIGAAGTLLWKKIQLLIADPQLENYPRAVGILGLSTTGLANTPSIESKDTQFLYDIKRGDGLINGGRYSIGFSPDSTGQRLVMLDIKFDLNLFCLSEKEIQRVYGAGESDAAIDSPARGLTDETGFRHRLSFINISFLISPSGCATNLTVVQRINQP